MKWLSRSAILLALLFAAPLASSQDSTQQATTRQDSLLRAGAVQDSLARVAAVQDSLARAAAVQDSLARAAAVQDSLATAIQDSTKLALRDTLAAPGPGESPFTPLPGWHTRKVIATTAAGGLVVGSLISSYYDWWHNNGQKFHFTSEGIVQDYSLGIDKIGHAYTSYFYFHSIANMMEWGGFYPETAFWWGAGVSAFVAVSIEIGDGFSQWGFSWEDLAFNMVGLGYAILQRKDPWFQNIGFKWSYFPAEGYTWPPHFTDHYDAHIYWLTFNMHNLLPSSVGEKWPEFVQLGVGYSVGENMTVRELVVGLDWNLEAIHTSNRELAWLIKQLNLFHFPAPGVKIYFHKPPEWKLILWN